VHANAVRRRLPPGLHMPAAERTVRVWLVLLVLTCLVPAAILAVLYIAQDSVKRREQLLHDSLHTTRALAAVVDQKMAGYIAALTVLAASPNLRPERLDRFASEAAALADHMEVNEVVLVDPGFQQLVNTLRPPGSALPVEHNAALRSVFDSGRPVVTDLFFGPVALKPVLAVGVPVLREGRVAYVLAAGVWTDRLSAVLNRQRLPAAWVANIFDGGGNVLARTREIERFAGRQGPPELLEHMKVAAEGAVENETLEGTPVFSAFSRSALTGWTLSISIPRQGLMEQLYGSLVGLAMAAALVLALAWLAAWQLGRVIGGSMRSLVEPAQRLGRGEAVSPAPSPVAEVNEIAGALHRASALLQQTLSRAQHDTLTGLANRSFFEEFVERQLALGRRQGGFVALVYLDLDGFKAVNDRCGHEAGDRLLVDVAIRMRAELRQADLLARLGGDEFAVVLSATNAEGAARVGAKLLAAVQASNQDAAVQRRPRVSASLGIAVFPEDGDTLLDLLHKADAAMYKAKSQGKGRVVLAAEASSR
jgi:diguanylate cyclase (GGDEF)-like protein